ncbi:threonine dehydratase [Fodinicurvata halophila]|uniref:Threonine dehydratase n=1 Tax=Fodinicurvata halophila TaxID=1419723 RepID=A0ABV8UF69_9PROT
MFSAADLDQAETIVREALPPTPQICWPQLSARLGTELWVKHENHTPVGAFKIRGGLVYMKNRRASAAPLKGIVSATRGNHGQSLAFAGQRHGISVTIVVPEGNCPEKNAAMRALGARLVESGKDFDEARSVAAELAEREGLESVPSFHPHLVTGVATYAKEFFAAQPDLDVVYAPIGMGSGICGLIRTRDLMGLSTQIVGVVTKGAPAYALSYEAGRVISTEKAETLADGMACRQPMDEALEMVRAGAERMVTLEEEEIADAIRAYYTDTHNLAEGAGAAPLAAALQERDRLAGKKVGVVLSGGNIARDLLVRLLSREETPRAA